jgi:prepilin-type N-terminal cleavage/methylation domain-containing protein
MRRPPHPSSPGFTLVEAIVAMVVVATLGTIASGLIFSGVASYEGAYTRAALHEGASAALERICAELRACPRDAGAGEPAPLISSVSPTSIDWSTSSLSLSGSTLLLSHSGGPAAPLLQNVAGLTIQCFDESNGALAARVSGAATRAIRRVSITLSVERAGLTDTLRTRVFIRSLMLGGAP